MNDLEDIFKKNLELKVINSKIKEEKELNKKNFLINIKNIIID